MWDYLVRNFETDDLEGWLNAAGDLGWELVHFHKYPDLSKMGGSGTSYDVIMKKPKAE